MEKGKNKNSRGGGFLNVKEYLSRELKGTDRNAFERILQKDAFSSEAMEGLSGLSAEQYQKDLAILNLRVKRKAGRLRRRIIYRVAASIAALMIISSVFLIIERNKSSIQIENENISYVEITKSNPVTKSEPEIKEAEQIKEAINKYANEITVKKTNAEKEFGEEEIFEIVTSPEAEQQKTGETEKPDIPEIPYAGSKIMKPDQNVASPTSETLNEMASGRMQTREKEKMDFVVVGYGAMKSKKAAKGSYSAAEPLFGIDSFKLYLRSKLGLHDSLNPVKSVIIADFRVLKDGKIDSIRVIKSPGQAFSEKFIKLIKEGPVWQAARKDGEPVDDDVSISVDLE